MPFWAATVPTLKTLPALSEYGKAPSYFWWLSIWRSRAAYISPAQQTRPLALFRCGRTRYFDWSGYWAHRQFHQSGIIWTADDPSMGDSHSSRTPPRSISRFEPLSG